MAETSDPNKRRHHRVPCNQVHRVAPYNGVMPRPDEFTPVMFNDISKSGFSYFTEQPPEIKEIVLCLDLDPPRCVAARIINCRPAPQRGRFIVGCEFTGRLDQAEEKQSIAAVS